MAGEKNTKREWLELRTKETLVEFSLTKYLTLHDKKKKKNQHPLIQKKKEWLYGLMARVKKLYLTHAWQGKMNQTEESYLQEVMLI